MDQVKHLYLRRFIIGIGCTDTGPLVTGIIMSRREKNYSTYSDSLKNKCS